MPLHIHDNSPKPLTDGEKALFDRIGKVTKSAGPDDLQLWRMRLDGDDVAVIFQRIVNSETGADEGWHPLAILATDDLASRLQTVEGEGGRLRSAEGLTGAA